MDQDPDDWDQHWSRYAEESAENPAPAYRRRLIYDLLTEDGKPTRIVDIGSGSGDLAVDLHAELPDAKILGIELSQHGVDIAAARVPDATFIQRDLLMEDDVPPGYDRWGMHAVCSEVLEHVDDPVQLLQGSLPYLAPGCKIIVTVPGGPMSAFDHHLGHRRHYTTALLRETLEEAGLQVERTIGAGFPFFNLYRLAVYARGQRLVEEASSASSEVSRAARIGMRVFRFLFRFNMSNTRFGWQIGAIARVPR